MLAVNAENHGNNKHVILPNKKYESFFIDSYFFRTFASPIYGRKEVVPDEKNIFVYFRMEAKSVKYSSTLAFLLILM